MKVQVLMTYHPDREHPHIFRRNLDLYYGWWKHSRYGVKVDTIMLTLTEEEKKLPRISKLAALRNRLVDCYFDPTSDVIVFADSDMVGMVPSEFDRMVGYSMLTKSIVAPSVYIEGSKERFYDLWAFVVGKDHFTHEKPYYPVSAVDIGDMPYVPVDGVGCLYAVPTEAISRGCRYWNPEDQSEHWGLCQSAKKMGYGVVWARELSAYHADLERYGLKWN